MCNEKNIFRGPRCLCTCGAKANWYICFHDPVKSSFYYFFKHNPIFISNIAFLYNNDDDRIQFYSNVDSFLLIEIIHFTVVEIYQRHFLGATIQYTVRSNFRNYFFVFEFYFFMHWPLTSFFWLFLKLDLTMILNGCT